MHCQQIREKINLYVDGELEVPVASAIENHLQSCGECREVFDRHNAIADRLDSMRWPSAPPDFVRSVRLAAENREKNRDASIIPFPFRRNLPTFVRIAATLVLVFGLAAGAMFGQATYRTAGGDEEVLAEEPDIAEQYLAILPADDLTGTYLALIDYGESTNDL